jgi:hypothetical protein
MSSHVTSSHATRLTADHTTAAAITSAELIATLAYDTRLADSGAAPGLPSPRSAPRMRSSPAIAPPAGSTLAIWPARYARGSRCKRPAQCRRASSPTCRR